MLRLQDLNVTRYVYANAGLMGGIHLDKIYPYLTKLADFATLSRSRTPR